MRYFKQFLFVLIFLSQNQLLALGHITQYGDPFNLVWGGESTIVYGDYVSISSSVMCVNNGGACDDTYNGYLFNANTMYKNSVNIATIPLNSSSKDLVLPSDVNGSDILYAGLYWQGNITGDDAQNYNTPFSNTNQHGGIQGRDNVIMITPDGNKNTLTANKLWFHDFWGNGIGPKGGHRSFYQGYADVTTLIQNTYRAGAINTYTVGNIKASAGVDYPTYFWADSGASYNYVYIGFWGHWNLVVVYQHPNINLLTPKPKPRNIALFQGFKPLLPLLSNSTKSIDINVTGFLTPKQTPINAKILFYGAAAEKKLKENELRIFDPKTGNYELLFNTLNPVDNAFNDSISHFGVPDNPNISFYPGLDSDDLNISTHMDVAQTSTSLRLVARNNNGTADQFFPGLIAFSTEVYEPSFCYDYAYKQDNRYFTEDNNGNQNPRIVGSVLKNAPVEVSIYLRNLVASDVLVRDMNMSIRDINTSQATYIRNTTSLARNAALSVSIPDTNIASVNDAMIDGIPIGNLSTNDYFYTYYSINPIVADLNISLNVTASYILEVSNTNKPVYSLTLSSDIPMCQASNYQYAIDKGAFNIVHPHYYDLDLAGGTKKYYNLPTQVTQRVGNFKVISIDANETLKPTSAIVSVEAIDAAAFHSARVSCDEIASAISPRVWVLFDNSISKQFNKTTLDTAYNSGMTTLNPSSDFYKEARENAGLRTSYALDNNRSVQQIEKVTPTTWRLINFPNYGTQTCVNNNNTITSVCTNSMTMSQLTSCMECVYGLNMQLTCSRDNFSIRPDAFYFQVNDTNQSAAPKQKIINNLAINNPNINLAAGYKYNLDINATNYLNTNASIGYTKIYGYYNKDDVTRYIWEPLTSKTCDDNSSGAYISYRIANGDINLDLAPFPQVGRYRFNIVDRTWTTVDNNNRYMLHHDINYPDGSAMFLHNPDGTIAPDCILNSDITQNENSTNLSGCIISSEHNNTVQNISYRDIFTNFIPYKFDLSNITMTLAGDNSTPTSTSYVYMADLNDTNSEVMSIHFSGNIIAQGEDNTTLTNFTQGCYAEPLDITIQKSSVSGVYKASLHTYDSNATEIRNSKYDISSSLNPVQLNTTDFTLLQKGSSQTLLNINLNRINNQAQNPQEITFNSYDVNCSTATNCSFYANLLNNKTTQGTKDLNTTTIKHYYARSHVTRQRFVTPIGTAAQPANVFIYYEVYCNGCTKTLLPAELNGGVSQITDDPRWYINPQHTNSRDGNTTVIQQKIGLTKVSLAPGQTIDNTVIGSSKAPLIYDGSNGYSYKTTMEYNGSPWLIYNKYVATKTSNEFEIEFINNSNKWAGKHETNTTTNINSSNKTNRRTMW